MSVSYLKQEGFGREAWGLHSPMSYSVSESNHQVTVMKLLELLVKIIALALVKIMVNSWSFGIPSQHCCLVKGLLYFASLWSLCKAV